MRGRAVHAATAAAALSALAFGLGVTSTAHAQERNDTTSRWPWGSPPIQGSGHVQSETRDVVPFRAIVFSIPAKLIVRQTAAREAIELRADDNLLALIETRVVDRAGIPTLEIATKQDATFSSANPITVSVDVRALEALAIQGSGVAIGEGLRASALKLALLGSGRIALRGLRAEALDIEVAGSGHVDVAGEATKLNLSIAGSGSLMAEGLKTDDARVSVSGSGKASLDAHRSLSVSIAGSGNVVYTGEAVVKSSTVGSGSVRKRGG